MEKKVSNQASSNSQLYQEAADWLKAELQMGWDSVKTEADWVDEEGARRILDLDIEI